MFRTYRADPVVRAGSADVGNDLLTSCRQHVRFRRLLTQTVDDLL